MSTTQTTTETTRPSRPKSVNSPDMKLTIRALRLVRDRIYVNDLVRIAEELNVPLVDLGGALAIDDD